MSCFSSSELYYVSELYYSMDTLMRFLVPTAGRSSRPRVVRGSAHFLDCPELQPNIAGEVQGLQKPFPATAFPQVGGERPTQSHFQVPAWNSRPSLQPT